MATKHAGGHNVASAIVVVEDKSIQIPAARCVIARLNIDRKLVSLDAKA
jgi:hypothetical protein